MEVLLLGIYSFFVWLIFIKFKWLPWNIYVAGHRRHHPDRRADGDDPHAERRRTFVERPSRLQVHGADRLAGPRPRDRSPDRGRQPAWCKKGDVLFRIDPTPYQLQVNTPPGAARAARSAHSANSRSR